MIDILINYNMYSQKINLMLPFNQFMSQIKFMCNKIGGNEVLIYLKYSKIDCYQKYEKNCIRSLTE